MDDTSEEDSLEAYTTDGRGNTNSVGTNLALLRSDIAYIKRDVSRMNLKLDKDYITREEFAPIKKLVYGLVSLILVGFVGALITLVTKAHP